MAYKSKRLNAADAFNKANEKNDILLSRVAIGSWLLGPKGLESVRNEIKGLIAGGADVNYARETGSSVLESAISGGDPVVVQMLLDAGARIKVASIARACNRAALAVENSKYSIFDGLVARDNKYTTIDVAARTQIAFRVIAHAEKSAFIGVNYEGKTVLNFAEGSPAVTGALKVALASHGLKESDLTPAVDKALNFVKDRVRQLKV